MINFVKKYLLLLKQDFKLFAVLSIPGIIFYLIGLHQLGAFSWLSLTVGLILKFAVEFLTISILFSLLHVAGFKNRWLFAFAIFLYYITITADIVLLMYFKERFSLKYLMTLEGAQYQFLFDIRLLLYFAFLYSYAYFTIRRYWHRSSRHASAKKIACAAVLLLALALISPLNYSKTSAAFYASSLMDTTVAGIVRDLTAKKPQQNIIKAPLPATVQAAADKYGLFKPTAFTNKNNFDRIILLTTEAFSNKFINSFNPAIPKDASFVIDSLIQEYPYASLKPVTLSTLYGLSVIFSGHPNAELIFKNKFPLSFVRILRDNGFKTAFIRGADEEYMDEHILFGQAGFDEVYGAKYFEQQPAYSKSVAWWGLTDRKLFEFTVDYLKKHRDEKVFVNILTVDSHVPSGRNDYLGQEYPPLDEPEASKKVRKIYEGENMARAFRNFNYDLGRFLDGLEKADLMDERTLLIITGDHPFFANVDTGSLFKNYKPVFDEVPLIFVSKKHITESVSPDLFKSQQDIAPTVLALAGIPAPQGMFGRSVFEPAERTVFNIKNGYVIINNTNSTKMLPFSSEKAEGKAVIELLNTAVTD